MSSLTTIWSTVTEVDTKLIREQAQTPLDVAILSGDADAVRWLTDALRTNPFDKTLLPLAQSVQIINLPADAIALTRAAESRLALIVIPSEQEDLLAEQEALAALQASSPHLPVVIIQLREGAAQELYMPILDRWRGATEVVVDPQETDPFAPELVPALFTLLPDQHVALAHHLPGLRPAIVRQLIKETSVANAGYAASTGIAELVPIFFIPANVADIIILSKNQALLAYKLALALGKDIAVTEMAAELAGVLGSGFIWRELARTLVGWVPGIGLVPKIAVAYAGTYVIGEAVYLWYAYGKQMTPAQMKALFAEALREGRAKAAALIPEKRPSLPRPSLLKPAIPRPRLPRRKAKIQD